MDWMNEHHFVHVDRSVPLLGRFGRTAPFGQFTLQATQLICHDGSVDDEDG
jgi:hypothetical protein